MTPSRAADFEHFANIQGLLEGGRRLRKFELLDIVFHSSTAVGYFLCVRSIFFLSPTVLHTHILKDLSR